MIAKGVAILTRAPRRPNPPGIPVFIYLSLFSKNETGIPAHRPLNDSDWAMSRDPRDRPESGTERRYCNKRALKGILEQKIKKIAAPAKIQIQKFDHKEDNEKKTGRREVDSFLQGKITKGGGSEKRYWDPTGMRQPGSSRKNSNHLRVKIN